MVYAVRSVLTLLVATPARKRPILGVGLFVVPDESLNETTEAPDTRRDCYHVD